MKIQFEIRLPAVGSLRFTVIEAERAEDPCPFCGRGSEYLSVGMVEIYNCGCVRVHSRYESDPL